MAPKSVIVAGATSALGREVAMGLSKKGWSLVLLGRDLKNLNNLKSSLPGPSSVRIIDVETDIENVANSIKEIVQTTDSVFGLVSFFGFIRPAPMMQVSSSDWLRSIKINLLSNVEMLKGFAQGPILAEDFRHVIFMSSAASFRGDLGLAPYAASKAALESLVRSSGRELAGKRITVNAVRLGLIAEGMGGEIRKKVGTTAFESLAARYPLGIGALDSALPAIEFLLNQKPVWTTGAVLSVDGGYSST